MGKAEKSNRSCTDVAAFLLFIIFTLGMGFVSFWAFTNGNAYMLLYGTDSWGNVCGRPKPSVLDPHIAALVPQYGANVTSYPKLYYFDFLDISDSVRLCVSQCPTPNGTLITTSQLRNYSEESDIQLCRYDVTMDNYTTNDDKICPIAVTYHMTVLNRCVPEAALDVGTAVLESVGNTLSGALSALQATCSVQGNFFDMASSDIEKTWREILYLCAIGFGTAVVMTLVLRFVAFIAIWLIVIGSGLGSLAAAGYCWYCWYTMRKDLEEVHAELKSQQNYDRIDSWMSYAIIASVVALVVVLILLVMRKRIALVAQLFKETGKAIAAVPSLLLQPFMTMVVMVVTLFGLIVTAIFMVTTDKPVGKSDGFVDWKPDYLFEYVRWPYLFGALWHVQFILACHQLVIAGTIGTWYFTRDKKRLGSPLCKSVGNLLRFHLGSAAFGALIVAIIQFIRAMLAFIQQKLGGRSSKVAEYIMKAVHCCLWCFEKIIKFINRNAYIMVAIRGKNFCSGAKAAFMLLLQNVLRVAAVNSVGSFCLFLAKLTVTAAVFAIGMNFFQNRTAVCYTWIPTVIGAMFAFCITHVYLSLYAMCIDTILLCFCIDCDENDGVTKPFYMSKSLMMSLAHGTWWKYWELRNSPHVPCEVS